MAAPKPWSWRLGEGHRKSTGKPVYRYFYSRPRPKFLGAANQTPGTAGGIVTNAAAGLEVVPYDDLVKSGRYAAFKDAQKPTPTSGETKDGRSVFVAAKGRPFYLENPERATAFQALGLGFGPNTRMGEVMLSYDLGQIHLLSVNMVVDFASLKTSGGFGASNIATDYGHFVHAKNTYYRLSGPNGPEMAKLTLKQVLASDRQIVTVTGQQFGFVFSSQDFKAGTQVEFQLKSKDVTHAFAIYGPTGVFIAQGQMIPGYTNKVRVNLEKPGTYEIRCFEYCGIGHHVMKTQIEVR